MAPRRAVLGAIAFLWRGAIIEMAYTAGISGANMESGIPEGPVITFGTMGTEHSVRTYKAGASGMKETDTPISWTSPLLTPGMLVTPPAWDSSLCMEHWGHPELQTQVDPKGYVVFVNGMEQLGGNKYLLADGMYIAKMLDRTLVEYPAKDARISAANTTLGLGAYWDLSAMCMNHRILDLRAFRVMVESGRLVPEDFVTIETGHQAITTHHFRTGSYVRKYFNGFRNLKVIVMEHTWKSSINRHTLDYLHPNPFYLGIVRMLMLDHEDFRDGEFLAVQWRTETATGNMTTCYSELRQQIEEHRIRLGFSREQVLFNTDMYGTTSGTFRASKKQEIGGEALRMIREDYPKALDNRLHRFFDGIKDSGVKAIVSGLVVARARVMLASSLNKPYLKATPKACVCQKPHSGYIKLIAQWRRDIMRKPADTVVRLWPFGRMERTGPATTTDSDPAIEEDDNEELSAAPAAALETGELKDAKGLGEVAEKIAGVDIEGKKIEEEEDKGEENKGEEIKGKETEREETEREETEREETEREETERDENKGEDIEGGEIEEEDIKGEEFEGKGTKG